MNKKLLISVLLFFFVCSLVMLADEKAQTIEHLVWADTLWEQCFYKEPSNHEELESFVSDPFLTFHVPASPKSDALFFEFWAQALYKWSGFETRRAKLELNFRIISGDIPDNIEVKIGSTVINVGETNVCGNYDIQGRRSRRYTKLPMRRNSVDWWIVYYKNSGVYVPENITHEILNNLMDNGFDVEVYTVGEIQGVSRINLIPVEFHVTRLSKN